MNIIGANCSHAKQKTTTDRMTKLIRTEKARPSNNKKIKSIIVIMCVLVIGNTIQYIELQNYKQKYHNK